MLLGKSADHKFLYNTGVHMREALQKNWALETSAPVLLIYYPISIQHTGSSNNLNGVTTRPLKVIMDSTYPGRTTERSTNDERSDP